MYQLFIFCGLQYQEMLFNNFISFKICFVSSRNFIVIVVINITFLFTNAFLTAGVLLTAVCLITEMCEKSPDTLTHFRKVRQCLW